MKILRVVFENLNSLVGKHEINFAQEFGAQGIFAIVGPTGSGKTTILDAICLALYGKTPRLSAFGKENEIMSRQTSECRAEAVFETNSGEQYHCTWTQRRARNRSDGNLQSRKHSIVQCGKEQSEENRDVEKIVEERTGMDFENFTRSMLLAQGEFAKFLKSDGDERAKILEQITGTEIYTKISVRVHERYRDVQNDLKNLREQLGNVEILDDEMIRQIEVEIADLKKSAEVQQRKVDFIKTALDHRKNLKHYDDELKKICEELQMLHEKSAAFQIYADKLTAARKSRDIEAVFNDLIRDRSEQDKANQEKTLLEKELPVIANKLDLDKQEEHEAETLCQETINRRVQEQERIKQVREIDGKINAAQSSLTIIEKQYQNLSQEKTKHEKNLTEFKETLSRTLGEESFGALQQEQNETETKYDSLMDGKNAADWRKEKESASGLVMNWKQVLISFNQREEWQAKKTETETEIANRKTILQTSNDLLKQLEAEKEKWDQNVEFCQAKASLAEHRKQLEDGKPCPCCGATEHPFAVQNPSAADSTASELKTVKKQQNDIAKKLKEAERQKTENESLLEHLQKSRKEFDKQIEQETQKIVAGSGENIDKVAFQTQLESAQKEVIRLDQRITEIETLQKQKEELTKRIGSVRDIQAKIETETEQIKSATENLETEQIELEKYRSEKAVLQRERTELFGNKNPDDVERKLQHDADTAQKQLDAKRQVKFETDKEYHQIKQRLITVTQTVAEKTTLTAVKTAEFEKQYRQVGFVSESEFLAARIEPNELKQLECQAQELQSNQERLETLRHDKTNARLTEEKKLTDHWASPFFEQFFEANMIQQDQPTLDAQRFALNNEAEQFQQQIGIRQEKLDHDDKQKAKRQELASSLEKQEHEAHLWGILHELIGSADGKKYKVYVQSLTFRYLIDYANRQLEKMMPRYLLVPKDSTDEKRAMELNIIDHQQAGAVRSTENLSGGESFLVSLALALGLSAMSSQKVRVDSLFLDEGFGTLDEETLETALNVLDGLRQEGKQIGIISHVPLIRERIPQQIRLIPLGGGRSKIAVGDILFSEPHTK
ncbi:nuclease SbcCD subunit C [Planctomycetales bacterium]|nr:nuclease SbcCD subunit C [Planctomycetales bacterium]